MCSWQINDDDDDDDIGRRSHNFVRCNGRSYDVITALRKHTVENDNM